MSIRALTDMALERDAGVPAQPRARARAARAQGAGAPGGAAAAPAAGDQSRTDVLVSAIPTEVLGPYTALVGLIVSTIDEPQEDERATLRWVLYGAGLVAIAVWLGGSYVRERTPTRKRRFPVAETIAALIAFAAWGLVMPGTPLALSVTGDDLTIATGLITAGGVLLVSLMAAPLRKPSKSGAT
jgi:hypothetical protein